MPGSRSGWFVAGLLTATLGVTPIAQGTAKNRLRPDPDALVRASPELVERLQADPFTYFRFINRPWIARVCEMFAEDLPAQPMVRLHGDAHLEQFAVMKDAWGLDDFDDSARGPALIDIVRFLGSIDLAVRQRGWTRQRDAVFDRFFAGYRQGLANPDYLPPRPDIVAHLRAQAPLTRQAFLAWGETKMEPMDAPSMKALSAGMAAFADLARRERSDFAPGYFVVVRAGWLHMGIGSAASVKVLVRVQGPSNDPDDDELLEGKELTSLGGLDCIDEPSSPPTLRIIVGTRQIGRLTHNILASGPELPIAELADRGRQLRDWWIRSWEPSYRELHLDDLRSVADLSALAFDSGEQLGAGCLHEQTGAAGAVLRKRVPASTTALEGRLRRGAVTLVDELIVASRQLRPRKPD